MYLLLLAIQNIHFGFPVKQNAFFNYSLLKGLSDRHNLDGIPQSWSLTVEICFYILAPFIYFFTRKNILKTLLYLLLLAGLAILIGTVMEEFGYFAGFLFLFLGSGFWYYNSKTM